MPPELFMTEIRVADWPRAVRWYSEVLALPVLLLDEPNAFALLGSERGRLALKAGAPKRPEVRLVFRVEDVEAERARLVAAGETVSAIEVVAREAYREFRLCDPEETSITLFQWA